MNCKKICVLLKRSLLLLMTLIFLCGEFSVVEAATPKVRKIKWSNTKTSIYMPVKTSKKLKVKFTPSKSKKRRLKWSSSNKKIATVSKSGKVTAKKTGTVTITCKVASQPKKKVKCKIRVVKPAKSISVSKSSVVLQMGKTYKRTATVSPKSATIKGVKYISSNPKIVTVDSGGKLTGKSEGTATIKIQSKDGLAKQASYKVQVIGKLKGSARFIAHRGLSKEAPENTLKAFQLAGEAQFWGTETDIRKTKDGHFILMHDDTLSRMCGINRAPEDMTLAEIRSSRIISGSNYDKYKTDSSATTIPTLEEYLQTCLRYHMVPVVEIKMSYDWDAQEPEEPDPEKPDPEEPNPEKPDPEKMDPENLNPENSEPQTLDSENAESERPDSEMTDSENWESEEPASIMTEPEMSEVSLAPDEEVDAESGYEAEPGSEASGVSEIYEEDTQEQEIPLELKEVFESEKNSESVELIAGEEEQLEEILEGLPDVKTDSYNMQLQSVGEDDLTELYDITQNIMKGSKVVFIGFDLKAILKMREIIDEKGGQNVELQHLVNQTDLNMIDLYKENGIGLDSRYSGLDISTAKKFMNAGITVNVWTLDDETKIWNYVKNKIPYITTNSRHW